MPVQQSQVPLRVSGAEQVRDSVNHDQEGQGEGAERQHRHPDQHAPRGAHSAGPVYGSAASR